MAASLVSVSILPGSLHHDRDIRGHSWEGDVKWEMQQVRNSHHRATDARASEVLRYPSIEPASSIPTYVFGAASPGGPSTRSVMWKAVPFPSSLSTKILPPCFLMISCVIIMPRPVPLRLVV